MKSRKRYERNEPKGSERKRNKYADHSKAKRREVVPCAGKSGGECEGLCTEGAR